MVRILLIAFAWAVVLAGLIWMMAWAGVRAADLPLMLRQLGFLTTGFLVVSVLAAALGAGFAFIDDRAKALIGAGDALVAAAVAALVLVIEAHSGLICMNPPIPFEFYAPTYAQALLAMLIGLTGACLVLAVVQMRGGRAADS